jgi:hypothetical protein
MQSGLWSGATPTREPATPELRWSGLTFLVPVAAADTAKPPDQRFLVMFVP